MSTLHGIVAVVRLVLRRDRLRLPVWMLGLGAVIAGSAASLRSLYPDQRAIDDYVQMFGSNPALVAFTGPGHGFDDPNLGVILVNETQLWGCIGLALMAIFLVNRHTRVEEDAERVDLLRSSVIGRHVPTAAAFAVVGGAVVVLSAALTAAFVGLGFEVAGSVALGASFAACGLAFAAIAALAAQLASGSRSSLGLATTALGASFVLRAIGDIADHPVRWASPIGWAQGTRAYADERWWPLVLAFVFAVGVLALAFVASSRRDLGSGILPTRPGPRRAARWMSGPLGLSVRLQRGSIIGWAVGLFVVGTVYGSIGEDVEQMLLDNPAYADFLAQLDAVDLTESFFATAMAMQALLAAGFAVSAALRARSEEAAGRAEPLLAAPLSRVRWLTSHLVVAAAGTVAVIAAGGLGIGLSYAAVSGDAGQVTRLLGAALVTVPGVLVLAGAAVALFGTSPRVALASWAFLGVTVLVQLFGEALRLPGWSQALSPLHHLPGLPAEGVEAVPLLALTVTAAALVAIGLEGFRRRDLRGE